MNTKSLIPIGQNRNGELPNPFQFLQTEIDKLFDNFGKGLPAWRGTDLTPSMDVTETEKEIEVTAELPGLEEKDVEISVADGLLTIRGEKKSERQERPKDKDYWLVERSFGSFSRQLTLPEGINPDDIKATIAKGILTVKVPKPAAKQTKKIEVKNAA
jgi:HSP20 family protein